MRLKRKKALLDPYAADSLSSNIPRVSQMTAEIQRRSMRILAQMSHFHVRINIGKEKKE